MSDTLALDAELGPSLTSNDVLSSSTVVAITSIEDGVAVAGWVCVEVIEVFRGPDGEGKPAARYYVDGHEMNPRE